LTEVVYLARISARRPEQAGLDKALKQGDHVLYNALKSDNTVPGL